MALVKAVLFDLGNTLVSYYSREEFPGVLAECIGRCRRLLLDRGVSFRDEGLWVRAEEQNHESPDDRVRPLEDRLGYIFGVDDGEIVSALCGVFVEPIFELGVLYEDVKPTLVELRRRGSRPLLCLTCLGVARLASGGVSLTGWG